MTIQEEQRLQEVEEKIGYVFKDKAVLSLALIHSTYANTYGGEDNERLEYLGDAVLELVVSENQYRFSSARPGEMTDERQRLVSKKALLAAVEDLKIKKYLRFAGREENLGAKAVSSLFETLTAAIWLDGGYDAAKTFVLKHIQDCAEVNYIKRLQEYDKGKLKPKYEEIKRAGPDNAPTFVVRVSVEGGMTAEGEGGDLTSAKQQAAKNLLEKL